MPFRWFCHEVAPLFSGWLRGLDTLRSFSAILYKEENVCAFLGPVIQSVVSLTSLLRVISLTVVADSIYNILIFFAEKM